MNTNFVLGMVLSDLCFTYASWQFSETGTTIISNYM